MPKRRQAVLRPRSARRVEVACSPSRSRSPASECRASRSAERFQPRSERSSSDPGAGHELELEEEEDLEEHHADSEEAEEEEERRAASGRKAHEERYGERLDELRGPEGSPQVTEGGAGLELPLLKFALPRAA
ncbi:hypothetical protein AK812_SmicGene20082 [Symbiodinium microadriaticum]|uniref:Uncharacterized protein n=1 Tax=Symbiodinium microadriaticum TaxID=2951 RepID=A0A1Q9DQZ6_SYMMI|nr:hypothetical protein AK812_SmicGene20082 [Symbiodinium microadriaticum]